MRSYNQMAKDKKPVYLFSGYLHKGAKTKDSGDTALAFQLWIGIQVPVYEIESDFLFDQHFPGDYLLDEILTFAVRFQNNEASISYGIASQHGARRYTRRVPTEAISQLPSGSRQFEISLGYKREIQRPPRPGFCGRLIIQATPWNK